MTTTFEQLSPQDAWDVLNSAVALALKDAGYELSRVPGRGRSNVHQITRNGKTQVATVRTSRDRWIAYPPLDDGKRWKTLDDSDVVLISTVDDRYKPNNIEVYQLTKDAVRKAFDRAYAEKIKTGRVVTNNFGMWISLDKIDGRDDASAAGLLKGTKPMAVYSVIDLLLVDKAGEPVVAPSRDDADMEADAGPATIAEALALARSYIAAIAGVSPEAVKLELKIEY